MANRKWRKPSMMETARSEGNRITVGVPDKAALEANIEGVSIFASGYQKVKILPWDRVDRVTFKGNSIFDGGLAQKMVGAVAIVGAFLAMSSKVSPTKDLTVTVVWRNGQGAAKTTHYAVEGGAGVRVTQDTIDMLNGVFTGLVEGTQKDREAILAREWRV